MRLRGFHEVAACPVSACLSGQPARGLWVLTSTARSCNAPQGPVGRAVGAVGRAVALRVLRYPYIVLGAL